MDVVRDECKSIDSLRDFPPRFLEKKLERGECVFLLDALDELGTREARDAVAHHVGQLASMAPPGNRIVVTSRIVGYSGELAIYGFTALTVQHLSRSEINQLVRRWYSALNEPVLADQLIQELDKNGRIYELATNPMLLSLIVLVQYVLRLIPDKRHILYEECIKILVERRYASPILQADYNKVLPSTEALYILRKIAYFLHKNKHREIPRSMLEGTILPQLKKEMPGTTAFNTAPDVILKNIESRSQLLVVRGIDDKGDQVMAFSHHTFQEYLTSLNFIRIISEQSERAINDEILTAYYSDPEWWEEVVLIYSAQLEGESRRRFMEHVYPKMNLIKTVRKDG